MIKFASKIFISLFLVGLSLQAASSITPISTISEFRASLESADQDTLVVFDVDRTLVIMGDQSLKGGKSGLKKRLRTYPRYNELSQHEQEILMSIVMLNASHDIIEIESLDLIRQLQNRNVKAIFCTTLETGAFGIIPDVAQWRVDSLNHLGLNFGAAFPELPYLEFFPGEKNSPVFKEGALISGKRDKGEALRLFFERINWTPKKIILIDDLLPQIESICNEFKDSPIDIEAFHYNYIVEFLVEQELDEPLVDFQMRALLFDHTWFTDEEAQKLINQ